ncbi:MAG: VWA domain-containing protein [Candidatus Lokiarchaeota archaeon]|nr:VWA domain-containing protein [Candidatus Lokiarchaeota archaeon]
MFVDYFYYLKTRLPVSITEYMTLIEALNKGLIRNIVEFYYVSRSILCKNEHHFDVYDIAFVNFFKDASLEFPEDIKQEIWDWLDKEFDPDELGQLPTQFEDLLSKFDLEDLQKKFEDLMREQDEEHNGGDHWIGTKGTSRFGHGGRNPMGIKVGGEGRGMRTAMQIAQKRVFKDYRKDVVLDTRQIKVALKRLRKLEEIGKRDELDMDKTIDQTAKNGGDIELVFEKRRKNNVKMLLIMDVGGSMTPYAHLVNLLFSAANQMSHWKDFKYYYFHNCPYEKIYFNAKRKPDEAFDFEDFVKKYDKSYKCVMVGDAAMASWELTERYGSIYYYHRNEMPGIYYIRELANHFKNNIVWLNPEVVDERWMAWTRKIIAGIIPMYNLTVDGIEEAMDYLRNSGKDQFTSVNRLKGEHFTRPRFN